MLPAASYLLIGLLAFMPTPAFAGDITAAELKRELAQVEALEKQYIESYRKQATLETADAWVEKIGAFLDASNLSRNERTQFLKEFDHWVETQRAHHALIDRLNIEKFNYFIQESRFYADETFSEFGELNTELKKAHQKLVEEHTKYLTHLGLYGTPKDVFRLAAIRDTFKASKEYFTLLEKTTSTRAEKFAQFRKKLAALPKRLWDNIKLLALVPDAVKLGSDILFRGGGKINATVNDAFVKAAELKGYSVNVKGMENLALATIDREKKTVNIIAKVHRGPVLDNMVLAKLHLKDYAFVTSFGGIIPKSISSRIEDNAGLAFVGPGFPNGIDTVTDKTIHNPERIMVNYAEGSIGNMGETRPIAEKFSTVMIPELRKKGYRVNLIPVTSQAASFMKKDIGSDLLFGKIIEARVHAPITNEVISFLESSGRLDDLGILIRSTWLSELNTTLDTDGKLIEGSLSMRGFEEMMIKYMNLPNSSLSFCPRLLAP